MIKLYSEIFGGNMKKYLFLPILLFFISCTAVNVSKVVSDSGISTVNSEIAETIEDLKEAAKLNEYEKLKEFFLPTFKNNFYIFYSSLHLLCCHMYCSGYSFIISSNS